jgi:hypothetical protein
MALITARGAARPADGSTWADKAECRVVLAVRGGGGTGVVRSLIRTARSGPMATGLVTSRRPRQRSVAVLPRPDTDRPDEAFLWAPVTAPDGGHKIAGIAAQHTGPLAAGEAFVKPIKAFGQPIMDVLGPMPYVASNMMLDDAFQKGARNYWKSHFLPDLTDATIDVLLDQFSRLPTPMSQIIVEHFHGAATRVPVGDTAYAMRDSGYNILIVSQWLDPKDDERCMAWGRQAYASLKPFMGPRRYINYLSDDDLRQGDSLAAVYGPNLPRLRQIKRKYDPENVFHLNLNIPSA